MHNTPRDVIPMVFTVWATLMSLTTLTEQALTGVLGFDLNAQTSDFYP